MKVIMSIFSIFCFFLSTYAQRTPAKQRFAIPTQIDLHTNLTGSGRLNKFFKANDGSIVSIRQLGDKVYAIADRYDRRFSSIWIGKVSSNTLKVQFHFIPKGKAKGKGSLGFKIIGSGTSQRLIVESSNGTPFNIKSLQAINKLPTKLLIDNRAWYRGNDLDNLTGRWKIKNVGQEYILDSENQIFTYTIGGRKTSHSRPQFATLFIGQRNGLNIEGTYIDLPLGLTNCAGKADFKIIGPHFIKTEYNHFYHGVNRERIKEDIHEILN